jgi:hypothetical protein
VSPRGSSQANNGGGPTTLKHVFPGQKGLFRQHGQGCLDVENLLVCCRLDVVRPMVACLVSVVRLTARCETAAGRPTIGCG